MNTAPLALRLTSTLTLRYLTAQLLVNSSSPSGFPPSSARSDAYLSTANTRARTRPRPGDDGSDAGRGALAMMDFPSVVIHCSTIVIHTTIILPLRIGEGSEKCWKRVGKTLEKTFFFDFQFYQKKSLTKKQISTQTQDFT